MPPVLTNEDKKKALSLVKRFETCLIVLGCKIDCSCFPDNICGKYNSTVRLVMPSQSKFSPIYWSYTKPSNLPARKIDTQSCVSTLIETVNHQLRKCILLSSKWSKEYIHKTNFLLLLHKISKNDSKNEIIQSY